MKKEKIIDGHKYILHQESGAGFGEPIQDIYKLSEDCKCEKCKLKRNRKRLAKYFHINDN